MCVITQVIPLLIKDGDKMVDWLKDFDKTVKQQNTAYQNEDNFLGVKRTPVDEDPFVKGVTAGNFSSIVDGVIEGNKAPTKPKISVEAAIDSVNNKFMNFDPRLSDASQFMKNIAATESNLGKDTLGGHSFSAFQIDPIRAYDIINKGQEIPGSDRNKRYMMANQYLQSHFNDPNFDLSSYLDIDSSQTPMTYNANANLKGHDPMVGAVLTRLALAEDPNPIPTSLDDQASYYSDYWNRGGTSDSDIRFKNQVNHHFPNIYP